MNPSRCIKSILQIPQFRFSGGCPQGPGFKNLNDILFRVYQTSCYYRNRYLAGYPADHPRHDAGHYFNQIRLDRLSNLHCGVIGQAVDQKKPLNRKQAPFPGMLDNIALGADNPIRLYYFRNIIYCLAVIAQAFNKVNMYNGTLAAGFYSASDAPDAEYIRIKYKNRCNLGTNCQLQIIGIPYGCNNRILLYPLYYGINLGTCSLFILFFSLMHSLQSLQLHRI